MKRYYACPIIGNGTEFNPHRPKLADYGVAFVTVLGSNQDGTPKKSWCLCLVDAVNHDPILADNQVFAIPDATLDSTFGSFNTPTRKRVADWLAANGIATGWITNNTLMREIIRAIGQEQDAAFSENNFDTNR